MSYKISTYFSQPGNPTGTTSNTGKMMGLAGTLTLNSNQNIKFILCGTYLTDLNNKFVEVELRYGTGSAPVNGDAPTGTVIGKRLLFYTTTANYQLPFIIQAIATNLTVGIAY